MDEELEAELHEEAVLDDLAAYEASAEYLDEDFEDEDFDLDDVLAYESDVRRGVWDDFPDMNEY